MPGSATSCSDIGDGGQSAERCVSFEGFPRLAGQEGREEKLSPRVDGRWRSRSRVRESGDEVIGSKARRLTTDPAVEGRVGVRGMLERAPSWASHDETDEKFSKRKVPFVLCPNNVLYLLASRTLT